MKRLHIEDFLFSDFTYVRMSVCMFAIFSTTKEQCCNSLHKYSRTLEKVLLKIIIVSSINFITGTCQNL